MRVEITSTDRIGISHEILAQIAALALSVKAVEVASCVTYLHIDENDVDFELLKQALLSVKGVTACNEIDLLPTESREQHLNALLRRIPDPIFDIDVEGKVLSCNYQSHIYINRHIESLFSVSFEQFKTKGSFTLEVSFEDKVYQAEITPLWNEGRFNGAVVLLKSLNRIGQHLSLLQSGTEAKGMDDILGKTPAIIAMKELIGKFSVLDLPVLISGETGTGKELVARAIHQQSTRNKGPFLAVNCAALPEHLLESELFGYVAGAFTGANAQGKPGLFELAQGGTVFLDEVAEMSVYLQAKLLRFLQDYSFRRLGGTKEYVANVRIISASHQPLEKLVKDAQFREDLYYRLNVLSLSLPALRERRDDIALLCSHFIESAALQVNLPKPRINSKALQYLSSYAWPGNVRQLQNVIFRLVALSSGEEISSDTIETLLNSFEGEIEQNTNSWLNISSWTDAQQQFEIQLLQSFLPQYPSTRKLAKRLGVSHNKIAMKLRDYNLKSDQKK